MATLANAAPRIASAWMTATTIFRVIPVVDTTGLHLCGIKKRVHLIGRMERDADARIVDDRDAGRGRFRGGRVARLTGLLRVSHDGALHRLCALRLDPQI